MTSKPSKTERKEDRIQQLEKELSTAKKQLSTATKTVHLDDEQVKFFIDEINESINASVYRIISETKPEPIIIRKQSGNDTFSSLLKYILSVLFGGFGILLIVSTIKNWSSYWIGGINRFATICVILIALICISISFDILKEKDRNYLVSLFSVLVSLVALVVTLVK